MLRILRLLSFLLFLPIILLVISLTIANLHEVRIALYPFEWEWHFPLILLLYVVFAAGVLSALFIGLLTKMRAQIKTAGLKRDLKKKERDLKKQDLEIIAAKENIHNNKPHQTPNALITKS